MIKPKSIHNQDIIDQYDTEYLYLSCVKFVKQVRYCCASTHLSHVHFVRDILLLRAFKVKKGPFSETSPMLNDISGVATWAKASAWPLSPLTHI